LENKKIFYFFFFHFFFFYFKKTRPDFGVPGGSLIGGTLKLGKLTRAPPRTGVSITRNAAIIWPKFRHYPIRAADMRLRMSFWGQAKKPWGGKNSAMFVEHL